MTIDLRKKLNELKAIEKSCSNDLWSAAHPGWEKHYVILEGETPWWEISDLVERKRVCGRQQRRMWRVRCHDHANAYNLKAMLVWNKTQVYTINTPKGKPGYVPAPYKRECLGTCELCGRSYKRLGWHHWIPSNPSVGVWACNMCHQFAEAVDKNPASIAEAYTVLKASVDSTYSRSSPPLDGMCELCGEIRYKDHHHWNDSTPNVGLWLCRKCHAFAERFDAYGEAFIKRYLYLKRRDELRVGPLLFKKNAREAALRLIK